MRWTEWTPLPRHDWLELDTVTTVQLPAAEPEPWHLNKARRKDRLRS